MPIGETRRYMFGQEYRAFLIVLSGLCENQHGLGKVKPKFVNSPSTS